MSSRDVTLLPVEKSTEGSSPSRRPRWVATGGRGRGLFLTSPQQPGEPHQTVRQFLDAAPRRRVGLRCGVCRDQDLRSGGWGRAPVIGVLSYGEFRGQRELTIKETRRRGFKDRTDQTATAGRIIPLDGQKRPTIFVFHWPGEGLRARCRHGHDLWFSADRFGALLDRPLGPDHTLYLPGS